MTTQVESTKAVIESTLVEVQFNNQTLLATLVDGVPYVAIKPICENLGVSWNGQFERINRHPVLSECIRMIRTTCLGIDGKSYNIEMVTLPLSKLNGWMFGIDANRVNKKAQDAVILYQEKCFDVLADYFLPKAPDAPLVLKNVITSMPGAPAKLLDTDIHHVPIGEAFNVEQKINAIILNGEVHVSTFSLCSNGKYTKEQTNKKLLKNPRFKKQFTYSHVDTKHDAYQLETIPLYLVDEYLFEIEGGVSQTIILFRKEATNKLKAYFTGENKPDPVEFLLNDFTKRTREITAIAQIQVNCEIDEMRDELVSAMKAVKRVADSFTDLTNKLPAYCA